MNNPLVEDIVINEIQCMKNVDGLQKFKETLKS